MPKGGTSVSRFANRAPDRRGSRTELGRPASSRSRSPTAAPACRTKCGAGLRALLHHQGDRARHRPRPEHGLWLRASSPAARTPRQPPGAGTTVTLLLPRAVAATGGQRAECSVRRGARHASGRPHLRLLLVEDDDDVAALTAEMLRHLGHDVSRVENAPAALQALGAGLDADLLRTDVVPCREAEDGWTWHATWRASGRRCRSCCIAATAARRPGSPPAGLPLLRKPFTLQSLDRALAQAQASPQGAQGVCDPGGVEPGRRAGCGGH